MEPEISTPSTDKQAPIETLPPSKPIWKSKILWGFMAISFLAAFLIGGLAVGKNQVKQNFPTPTITPIKTTGETANWKRYTNSQYGFSFNYPPSWKVWNGGRNEGDPSIGYVLYQPATSDADPEIGITKESKISNGSSKQTIGGKQVYINYDLADRFAHEVVYFNSGKGYYIALNFVPLDRNNSYKNQLGEIMTEAVSSFKFTK